MASEFCFYFLNLSVKDTGGMQKAQGSHLLQDYSRLTVQQMHLRGVSSALDKRPSSQAFAFDPQPKRPVGRPGTEKLR